MKRLTVTKPGLYRLAKEALMRRKMRDKRRHDRAEQIIMIAGLAGLAVILLIVMAMADDLNGISPARQMRAALTTSDIATDAEIRAANGTGPGGMEP